MRRVSAPNLPVGPGLFQVALDPLDSSSRSDVITRRLQQAIALGLFEDGAPLPSEADLAAQLQVSTVTLRASLADLRREGLIVTRRGRGGGSFIRTESAHDHTLLTKQLIELDVDTIRDARDLQVAITGRAAHLAAARARGREAQRLAAIAGTLTEASAPAARVRADFRFHAELAATTHSARLTRAEMAFMSEMAPYFWISGFELFSPEEVHAEHRAIVEAVQDQDPEAARILAERHVHDTLDALIELRMQLGRRGEHAS